MKPIERQQAESLRKEGATYAEIQQRVAVSKSTLSVWLRGIPLTEKQKARIYGKDLEARRKFVEYNERKRQAAITRHHAWEEQAKTECGPLSVQALKWIGVALYWAEGTKGNGKGYVKFSNSDPQMIRLIMRWFREVCEVPEQKFWAYVQVHSKQGLDAVEEFWFQVTGIPRSRFTKPHLKVSRSSQRRRGNILPNGTVHVGICDTQLYHRILGWIQGLSAPSSSGLGRSVLSQETGVRFPVGPLLVREPAAGCAVSLS